MVNCVYIWPILTEMNPLPPSGLQYDISSPHSVEGIHPSEFPEQIQTPRNPFIPHIKTTPKEEQPQQESYFGSIMGLIFDDGSYPGMDTVEKESRGLIGQVSDILSSTPLAEQSQRFYRLPHHQYTFPGLREACERLLYRLFIEKRVMESQLHLVRERNLPRVPLW